MSVRLADLPDDLAEEADQPYDGNTEWNKRVFRLALWFIRNGQSDAEFAEFIAEAGISSGYPRRDLETRVLKTYADAEEKFDPLIGSGAADPDLMRELTEMRAAVEAAPKVLNKTCLLALVDHAIDCGRNPVHASARQLAALSGKSVPATARSMTRLQQHPAILSTSYDGAYGHSRLWELDAFWRPGGLHITSASTYVTLPAAEERFVEWVEPMKARTELTVSDVSSALTITRPQAKKLLEKYEDEFFGGGRFEGDRNKRAPMKWWRTHPADITESRLREIIEEGNSL